MRAGGRRAAVAALALAFAPLAAAGPAVFAQEASDDAALDGDWGVLAAMVDSQWVTNNEARTRISTFKWEKGKTGKVLIGRHGYESDLHLGDRWFDIMQTLTLDPATGTISSRYTYSDGRPALESTITVRPDGSLEEVFTQGGVRHRNVHSVSGNRNLIARAKESNGAWQALGESRKVGETYVAIARRQEQARIAAAEAARRAQAEAARRAEEQELARMEEEAWEAEQQAYAQANRGPNAYEILTGLADQARIQADRSRAELFATIARGEAQARREQFEREQAQRQQQSAAASQAALAERQRMEQQQAAQAAERQRQEAERARAAEAERQRQEQARLAEARRREEEANRPVEFAEGVVLCEQRSGNQQWRCKGPLQLTYANFNDAAQLRTAMNQACGSNDSWRELGSVSGYRAFGCGFGIHPTARDYPGNADIPAEYGVGYVPGRGRFFCKKSVLAYCRGS